MTNSTLYYMLNTRFFTPWSEAQEKNHEDYSLWKDTNLELYVTNTCNQKCEYCYLTKYEGLYPAECNNPETILKNQRILFDWFLEKRFAINSITLFSGEIWHMQFGWDVLDTILEYLQRGLRVSTLTIPTNATFVAYEDAFYRMDNYVQLFRSFGCQFVCSGSIDGKVVDTVTRVCNDENETAYKNTDEFYDRFFSFWKQHQFRFHPMVAAENIDSWIENFKWWKEKCEQYGYDVYQDVMMLEVRNDSWTQDKIDSYLRFVEFLIDDLHREYKYDTDKLFNYLICSDIFDISSSGYINFTLIKSNNFQGCTVSDTLTVRLGDLAIPACHRTAYDNLLYGKFITEDNKIVDIQEINPQMASRIYFQNSTLCSPKCDACIYNDFCMRGCYGAQHEVCKDPFMPISSVCELFRQKLNFLIRKFDELGILERMEKMPKFNVRYFEVQDMLSKIKKIKESWTSD